MSFFESISSLPDDFDGTVRLFPLPNLVMFPHVVQPLHIFEMRYREMLEEAVERDKLIAMALVEPGWESGYQGNPPIFPTVCIGKIVNHVRLPDGKYNLLLLGVKRAKIIRELPSQNSFRRGQVKILEDVDPVGEGTGEDSIHQALINAFREFIPKSPMLQEQLEQLLNHEIPLNILTDMVSHTLSLDIQFKMRLLKENHVVKRATMLMEYFNSQRSDQHNSIDRSSLSFPPPFSEN
jgi:uncharacterized protein